MSTTLEQNASVDQAAPAVIEALQLEGSSPAKSKKSFLRTTAGKSLLGVLLASPLLGGVGYWLSLPPTVPPEIKLKNAEEALNAGKLSRARSLARDLQQIDYRDPLFPGGVEYILGMAAFREALKAEEAFQEQLFVVAVNNLKIAEERSVRLDIRPQWAYALAVSLCKIGLTAEARPLLEDEVLLEGAFPEDAPEKTEAQLLLADQLLAIKTEESLGKAEQLNSLALAAIDAAAEPGVIHNDQVRVRLQRVQIELGLQKGEQAKEALGWVRDKLDRKATEFGSDYESLREIKLLLSQTLIEDGRILARSPGSEAASREKYQEASKLLRELAKNPDLDQAVSRQATYLLGICLCEMGDFDNALRQFEMVSGHGPSQEATAARLMAGDTWRKLGGHDGDALTEYSKALRSVQSLEGYRNRWIDQKGFQNTIRVAWEAWLADGKFERAIALAEMMTPLFPPESACEFSALATQAWAEAKQQEYDKAPQARKEEIWEEVRRRWNRSGFAYERLAESLTASVRFGDAIWTSAEHYVKGQQHDKALRQLDTFIATHPTRFLPTALVLRGKTLMSLGKFPEAIQSFEEVIANHGTDVSALQADYLIGKCYLEQKEPEKAEKRWRQILQNPRLKPDAMEWQLSLLGVANVRFNEAEKIYVAAEVARRVNETRLHGERLKDAESKFESAIGEFEQYLSRYPQSVEKPKVLYDLAVSYRHSADLFAWARADAANENTRVEADEDLHDRLSRSLRYFQSTTAELERLRDAGNLDRLDQKLLRNSYFETADVLWSLGKFKEAIDSYTMAANRYPKQSDTLLAYVRVAECYKKLNKSAEAHSMIEQAKVILREMPPEVFETSSSQMSKPDWEKRLEWASEGKY